MRDWLTHRADVTPAATAVIDTDADVSHSYADLDEAVDRTAGALSARGVEVGDHVGLLLDGQLATIRLVWATMRLGAVAVPFRPTWEPSSLRGRLDETDTELLICEAETESLAVEAIEGVEGVTGVEDVGSVEGVKERKGGDDEDGGNADSDDEDGDHEENHAEVGREGPQSVTLLSVDEPGTDRVEALANGQRDAVVPTTWTRPDPASIVFTSGTTGTPQPVVLTMENHLANATDSAFRFGTLPADRWMSCHDVHHIAGLSTLLRATLYGSTLVVPHDDTPGVLADLIDTHAVTCLSAPPRIVEDMLDARGMLSDSLRAVLVGGAPVPRALLERCQGYSTPVFVTYCLTEAAGIVAGTTAERVVSGSVTDTTDGTTNAVGRPLLRSDLTILDADGTPVRPGQVGELVVSGPSVSPGYYDPGDSEPVRNHDRGIATGDVGRRDEEGTIHLLSRWIDWLRIDDTTVRAADVRRVIREHDAVSDAAVVGVSDTAGRQRLGALVVCSDDSLDADHLADHCRERLASFVVPDLFAFASSLPRTPAGDIDRLAVTDRVREVLTVQIPDADEEITAAVTLSDGREPEGGEWTAEGEDGKTAEDEDGKTAEDEDGKTAESEDGKTAESEDERKANEVDGTVNEVDERKENGDTDTEPESDDPKADQEGSAGRDVESQADDSSSEADAIVEGDGSQPEAGVSEDADEPEQST